MPSDEIAFRYFVQVGLTAEQAAGAVGNLLAESNLQPKLDAREDAGYYAHGIAMWGPPRWAALNTWAAANALDPNALETQLQFVWRELTTNTSFGLRELQATRTIEAATTVFEKRFERPKAGSTNRRIALARATFAKYAGVPLPPPAVFVDPAPVEKRSYTMPIMAALAILGGAVATAYTLKQS